MSLQFITEVVEPSKALTRYELKNIKLYIAGGADNMLVNELYELAGQPEKNSH